MVQGVLGELRLQHDSEGSSFAGTVLDGKIQAIHTTEGKLIESPILNELLARTIDDGPNSLDDVSWTTILMIVLLLCGVLGVLSYFQS